jgi:hypothetical protein
MRLALSLTIQLRAVAAAMAALLIGCIVPSATGNPSHLHYCRLTANDKRHWMASSAIKLSRPLRTGLAVLNPRGDECLNCDGRGLMAENDALPMRVQNARRMASR